MMPMATNIIELSYGQVLIEHFQKSDIPYFAMYRGTDATGYAITKIWTKNINSIYAVGSDVTAMDKHTTRAQLNIARAFFKYVFAKPYHKQIDDIFENMVTIPLIVDQTTMYIGEHALCSGSGLTNIVESLIRIYIGLDCFHFTDEEVIGDDSLGFTNIPPNPVQIVKGLSTYGYPANEDKQNISLTFTEYAKRMYTKNITYSDRLASVYLTVFALNSLLHQSRYYNPSE